MLFGNKNKYDLELPSRDEAGVPITIAWLVQHLCDHVMKDSRRELFVLNNSIRPGILVLINEADWELEGEDKYEILDGDNILFVSTLHGG